MSRMPNAEIRKNLVEAHQQLDRLNKQMTEDNAEAMVLPGFADYYKNAPQVLLDRARRKLEKKGYNVAFAGAMKAGKSTLINALVKGPDLLPAAVYECTLSTTKIGAPPAGQPERVEVSYFARDEAIRNIIGNLRYEEFFKDKDKVLSDYSPEKAIAYIQKKASEMRSAGQYPEQCEELAEFVDALDKYGSRLGHTHVDTFENAPQYLTVNLDRKGMGHLLLIRQVTIYKKNPIFSENGIEIVDLPGTDSTNPRQRELTHSFMNEADVVFLILEAKGFTDASKAITEKLKDCNQEVRNKMFIVLNKWDVGIQQRDLEKAKIESLYVNEIKARTIRWGLNPDRIFITSALWEELRLRKEMGKLNDKERQTLSEIEQKCGQAYGSLDSSITEDLLKRLKIVYRDGGLQNLRDEMTAYLKEEIERERLKDVYLDLMSVFTSAKKLLEPERADVAQMLADARNRLFQVGKFLDEMIYRFDNTIQGVDLKLEKAVAHFVNQAKEGLMGAVKMVMQSDNRYLSFRKIRTSLAVPSPARIKTEAIVAAKAAVAEKIVEIVEQSTVPPVLAKLNEELGKLNSEKILAHFDKYLKSDYGPRYERIVKGMERDIKQATRLRSMEEAWELQTTEMQPS
ncbi:MAG TPA: dynamin family protein, partial [Planctomycetota bacterium]|nr:dynamin family protein [Planctomycetota bacterium]